MIDDDPVCARCKRPIIVRPEHEFCDFRANPIQEEWQAPHKSQRVFEQTPITHDIAPQGARPPTTAHEYYGGSDELDNLRQDTSRKIFEEG